MATDKAAIDKFLARDFPRLPDFKSMPRHRLLDLITQITRTPFAPKREPRLYQLQGIAAMLWLRQGILYYDPQMGKTLCALQWAEHLRQSGAWQGTGFILAHAPTGLDVWQDQAAEHSNLSVRVVRTNPDDLFAAIEEEPDLICMTYSGMQQLFCEKRLNRKGKPTLYLNKAVIEIVQQCFSLFIIDEIHLINNPWGLWFELAEALSHKCEFRLGLTGTPLNRDPFATWAPLKVIDGGQRLGYSFPFFRECFGRTQRNFKRGGIDEIVFDGRKMPILSTRIATASLSYERGEAGINLKLVENVVNLGMAGDQADAYEDCMNEILEVHSGEAFAEKEDLASHFARLRQISSGYVSYFNKAGDKRHLHYKDSIKLEWLGDFLDQFEEVPPMIIFNEYVETGDILAKFLTKRKIKFARLYGGTSAGNDRTSIAAFQAGEVSVFLANSQSGGTSITLNRADYTIFFESPCAPIGRKQAQARAMANRGDRPLFITDLCCSPTERRILDFIAEGMDLEQALRNPRDRKHLLSSLKLNTKA
jgi:superfamily II DNA or RNA helicase